MPADRAETSDLAVKTLAAIADAVVTLDAQGVITSWNAAAESILGHPASEMVGSTLAAVIPEEFRAGHMAGFHAAMTSGTLAHGGRAARVQAVTATEGAVPLVMTLGLLSGPDGEVSGAVSVLRRSSEAEIFA